MKNFCYRITCARSPTHVKMGGSVRATDADAAIRRVMQINKITVQDEYYDADSMMAGFIFRTDFIKDGKPVSIAVTPDARHYR